MNSNEVQTDDYPSPGTTLRYFGDYELHEEIARGGMGVVYRARQVRLNRRVALKMIRAGKFSSGTEIQRLRVEAEAAAQLDHPAIVPVFEVGEHEGLHYFTMAFVDGETLSAKLGAGPMPIRAAAKLMQTVSEAVAYAHEKGVIHRDLKPGNILIDQSGQPRVSDFGLAKQVSSDNELTTTGQILGTPSYMPPEQALGKLEDIGKPSDIYSLGAVLYATLTGRPPFQAQTSVETLRLVVEELPLAPRLLNPSIPRDLETICLKCLEKSISRRYESAKAVAEELGRFLSGEQILAQPASRIRKLTRWYRRHWAAATTGLSIILMIAVVAAVLAVTAGRLKSELTKTANAEAAERKANEEAQSRLWDSYLNEANAQHRSRQSGQRFGALRAIEKAQELPTPAGRSRDELRTAAIAAICLPDLEVDTVWPYPSGSEQFAFDGDLRLFGAEDRAANELVVRDMLTQQVTMRLPRTEWTFDYSGPIFSPDSRLLVYPKVVDGETRQHLWRVGSNEAVADLGKDTKMVSFRPDSLRCATGSLSGLVRILDCQSFDELHRYETGMNGQAIAVAWNPRFSQLAIMDRYKWRVLDVDSGATLSELEVPQGLEGWPAWDPAGGRLAIGMNDHRIGIWDAATTQPVTVPLKGHRNGGVIVRFSPTGDYLLSNDWNGLIRLWEVRSGQPLLSVPAQSVKLQFSQQGTRLGADVATDGLKLFSYKAGKEFRTIWEHPGRDSSMQHRYSVPCISKTGRLLAIASDEGICLIDLNADEVVGRIPTPMNGPLRFHDSPEGESLWTYGANGLLSWPVQIFEASHQATIGPPELLENSASLGVWGSSKNGDVLLLPSTQGGYLLDRKSGRRAILPHPPDVRTCAVSPDGRIGVTGSHPSLPVSAIVWNLTTEKKIADLDVSAGGGVFFSPDGKWLVTNGDGTRIWKAADWSPRILTRYYTHPCFSPDSQLLALSDELSVVRLIVPETGRVVAVLTAPVNTALAPVAFTPDGGRLVTLGAETGAVHIFDMRAIRHQLAEMDLDWDYPPFPPEIKRTDTRPLKMTVDSGNLTRIAEAIQLRRAGQAHYREGRIADAIESWRKAVEIDPDNAETQNQLAWMLVAGPAELRNPEQALAAATIAVAKQPNERLYLNTLGVAQYRAGKWDDAIRSLTHSASGQDPVDSFDSFFLAMAHWQRGEHDVAREWLAKAIAWMDKNKPTDAELIEFRREAVALVVAEM